MNMRLIYTAAVLFLIWPGGVAAQTISHDQAKRIIERVEKAADKLADSLEDAIEDSSTDSGTRDRAKRFLKDFESATDRLEDDYDDENSAAPAAEAVLRAGRVIHDFVSSHPVAPRVEADWRHLQASLDELARAYNVNWSWPAAGRAAFRLSHEETEKLIKKIEDRTDRFKDSLDDALDDSRLDGSEGEEAVNEYIKDFEKATDRLKGHFSESDSAVTHAKDVLSRAARIERFMQRNALNSQAQRDWIELRNDLDQLGRNYGLTYDWTTLTLVVRQQ